MTSKRRMACFMTTSFEFQAVRGNNDAVYINNRSNASNVEVLVLKTRESLDTSNLFEYHIDRELVMPLLESTDLAIDAPVYIEVFVNH